MNVNLINFCDFPDDPGFSGKLHGILKPHSLVISCDHLSPFAYFCHKPKVIDSTPHTSSLSPSLPIMEAFYTLQGEGHHNGRAAYFIRVGGCDVGCSWCDVKESWDAEVHPVQTVNEIVGEAAKFPAKIAVITGGEPLIYDMSPLTAALVDVGFNVHLETSGAYPLTGVWHWICLSPKKFQPPVGNIHQKAHELKIIIYNKDDFRWAEEHAALVSSSCKLYLQPEWSKAAQMGPLIVDYVKENPKWNVSLQTHKYLNIP